MVERPPSRVRAQVRGTGLDLIRLILDPPPIQVSASKERVEVLEALTLSRASDAQVESVSPRVIELKTEPRVRQQLPVHLRLNVKTAENHELIDEPDVSPDSITVSGAQSIVDNLSAWPTDSLVLKNIRDTVRKTVALKDTLNGLAERSEKQVTVVARAGKFAVETRKVMVEVTGIPAGQDLVTLQPSSIRIQYRVLFDQLFASRRSSEFFATVSYSQIRSDTTGFVRPRIQVPSDLVIRDPEPIPARLRYYTFLSDE